MSYFVYILRTSSNTLYIGQTNNLKKRLQDHKAKTSKSAKYLRYFVSFKLVYTEKFPTRVEAIKRELQLKRLSHAKKEILINSPKIASKTLDFYCDFVFSGKVKVKKVKETNNILAFYHTKPSWTTHIVIVPKKHIPTLLDLKDKNLIEEIFEVAKQIIKEDNLEKTNFKIITNGGKFQDSKHLHFHLVSGNPLRVYA